ncbi:MAG: DUF1284 domain-containing protein [Oscillospiraceae bacterium]|nr:DUF1284 domain-containing protein [Oscillospiraceae bacterium]
MKLKPHHALCILLFSPEGHSEAYADAMRRKIQVLDENPQTAITLTAQLDEICGFCLYNNGGECEKAEETEPSDDRVLAWCGLEYGMTTPWSDLRERLDREILAKNRLHTACEGCMYVARCDREVKNKHCH